MSDNTIDMIAMAVLTGVVFGVLSIIFSYIRDIKKKASDYIHNQKKDKSSKNNNIDN